MLDMFRRPTDKPEHNELYAVPAGALAAGYLYSLHTGQGDMTPLLSLTSALLCVGGIGGLASQQTARLGNVLGMSGSVSK